MILTVTGLKEEERLAENGNNRDFRQGIAAAALLVLLIGGGLTMSGGASASASSSDLPNELTQIQNGTAIVTINSGSSAGSTTITYSPAYTSVPKVFATMQGTPTFTVQVVSLNPQAIFQYATPTTWTNMPAIDSEIYGDTLGQHQNEVNLASAASFRFGVTCIAASNTLGAYLTVMYSQNGVTWTEMNSAQRFLIDNSNGACPTGSGEHYASPTYASIPAGAKTPITHLRVDGVGGGGLGDTPSFASLWIDYSGSATGQGAQNTGVTGAWRICGTLALCTTPIESLTTGFIIQVIFPIPTTATLTIRFTWKAGVIA